MTMHPAKPGDVVGGKYVIEALIGEGGMGLVYSARHQQLDQLVAIKFLTARGTGVVASERFLREARAAARIRGEHVCRVLDIGEHEGGIPYMVMEHLVGRDLADELAERGRIPATEAVDYLLDACLGLAEAHGAGIVHRDLKPGNLFVVTRPDGSRCVKVLDFGVSKIMDPDSEGGLALTATSTLIGSPLYMSPEQLESSKDVDPRTDIWALGIVLYELLVGRPPFVADTVPQLVNAVLHAEVRPFAEAEVEAPAGLEEVVMRALSRDRDARYADINELASALLPFAGDRVRGSFVRAGVMTTGGGADVAAAAAAARDGTLATSATVTDASGAPPTGGGAVASRGGSGATAGTETPANWERPSRSDPGSLKRLWPIVVLAIAGAGVALWLSAGRSGRGPVASDAPTGAPSPASPAAAGPGGGGTPGAARPGVQGAGTASGGPAALADQAQAPAAQGAGATDATGSAQPDRDLEAQLPDGVVPGEDVEGNGTGAHAADPDGDRDSKTGAAQDRHDDSDEKAAPRRHRRPRRPRSQRARKPQVKAPAASETETQASPTEAPLGAATPEGAIPEYGGRR